jgi:hypothetical protein
MRKRYVANLFIFKLASFQIYTHLIFERVYQVCRTWSNCKKIELYTENVLTDSRKLSSAKQVAKIQNEKLVFCLRG